MAPAPRTVLAVGAHPDDLEFMMAGTLLLLQRAGLNVHVWNLANGSCGTVTLPRDEIVAQRTAEAQAAARRLGAVWHPPLVDDLMIHYEPALLARVAAVVRGVKPDLLLLPSPHDYMEDHQNTSRLLVSAAFTRGMRNFITDPPTEPWAGAMVLYHACPYGLRDGMRQFVRPGQYVDVSAVLAEKRALLAEHRSQKEWLDKSQGLDAYLIAMERMTRELGQISGWFAYAEGWRRHSHLGFAPVEQDILAQILGKQCWVDPEYEASLG